jgi:hypothetical protein
MIALEHPTQTENNSIDAYNDGNKTLMIPTTLTRTPPNANSPLILPDVMAS